MATKAKKVVAKKKAAPKAAAKKSAAAAKKRGASAAEVHERLSAAIPKPKCELDHENAWHLVVATILSAQSTDKGVNRVTPILFQRYPTPAALAAAPQEDVEVIVKPTGFFRNKAKAIRGASQMIVEKFGGEVPRTMEEILELPGVARKTGNVVLGTAYGVASGVVVDTHAGRVARRLGLTAEEDPAEVEQALMELFARDTWIDTGHRLVLHGRYVCTSKDPQCEACPLNEICPSRQADGVMDWEDRAARERRVIESRGAEV